MLQVHHIAVNITWALFNGKTLNRVRTFLFDKIVKCSPGCFLTVDVVFYSTFIGMDILGQSECAISQTIMTLLLGLISFASITYTISSNTDSHVPKVASFWD